MTTESTVCRLFDLDGTLIAVGAVRDQAAQNEALVTMFDQPGRIVQRVLLGGLKELRVQFGGDTLRRALVDRVFYDPKLGRACALTLAA